MTVERAVLYRAISLLLILVGIDCNHVNADGTRDFLLFIPVSAPNLHAVMSYYSATLKVNSEGDVLISDDTIQGLGTAQRFLHFFFGSLFLVAKSAPYASDYIATPEMAAYSTPQVINSQTFPPRFDDDGEFDSSLEETHTGHVESFGTTLIACVPNSGYFVAGGIAGIISRTSTAPLDRLKVYLIAQTNVAQEAVAAAKHGNIVKAALNAWRPLAIATKELWQAGGMRSLYAGEWIWRIHRGRPSLMDLGNGLNVVKVMPESAIKFGSYEASVTTTGQGT